MKKSRFTEEQITFALRQADAGTAVAEVCRKMGISEGTFYVWKKRYGNLGVTELRQQAGFNTYTFELKPIASPTQKQILEQILPSTKRHQMGGDGP